MQFRALDISDSSLLFKWRNSPVIWRYYLNPRQVSLEEHEKWFTATVSNPLKKIFLGLVENVPVGYIRFDLITETVVELSWCLSPTFHGRGLGHLLLKDGLKANPFSSIKYINAIIHNENLASVKIAEANQFKILKSGSPFSTYQMSV